MSITLKSIGTDLPVISDMLHVKKNPARPHLSAAVGVLSASELHARLRSADARQIETSSILFLSQFVRFCGKLTHKLLSGGIKL